MKYLCLFLVILFIVQWSLKPKPLSEGNFGKPVVVVGELWRWTVKLKPIHGMHNSGGFNLERWARMREIIGSGYAV